MYVGLFVKTITLLIAALGVVNFNNFTTRKIPINVSF